MASRHQPELPHWHLRSDGLWEVTDADQLSLQRGGFPRMAELRRTSAGLTTQASDPLREDPSLLDQAARLLLDRHFPESLHQDLLDTVGLSIRRASAPTAAQADRVMERPTRDPEFRRTVLRAYEHRCAVTGFRAALSGSHFGVEAAHVMWHSSGGPDRVSNGLALNPLMHHLFDHGAWTLSDDRRILVSAEFTGSDEALRTLRDLHGNPLRAPLPGYDAVEVDHIHWHRDAQRGGVFRGPALALGH